jgi:hypothetical protein
VTTKPFIGFDGRQASKEFLTLLKSEGIFEQNKPLLEISEKEL